MKKLIDFTVLDNLKLNYNTHLLKLHSEDIPDLLPGQFVNIKCDGVFLRRPISVCDYIPEDKLLYIMVKNLGTGSYNIINSKQGSILNILLPLGNSFNFDSERKNILIGGGVGIAPMLLLAKKIYENGLKPTVLIGGRTREDILLLDKFMQYSDVYYTTEDGSLGEKGFVTQHSILDNKYDDIFCCGPEPMMKAIAKYSKTKNIRCNVSLENTMACGIGACLCCVTDTVDGNKCVCTEGPIFNINDLKWQI